MCEEFYSNIGGDCGESRSNFTKSNKWENMSHDSSFRTVYEAREKLLLDEQAKLAHAEQEGMEKGIEQGNMLIIRGMHEIGVPLETIAKASKLSVEGIERILKIK
ncbi:hypothetical protein DZB82_23390 [Bacillus sp. dmp5]|nr:hypothetical protein DZB82_23390 [Bacillus sp. dmp5]